MDADHELLTYASQNEHLTSKVHVSSLAAKQYGRVTRAQLRARRVAPGTVARWIAAGYLIPVLPRVYAVGHFTRDEASRLFSLVLFAGPSATLSHGTSAHWRGWLRYPVRPVHVSTPRRIRTRLTGVVIHSGRDLDRELVDGIPCTTVIQTLLDLAATEPPKLVHRALAQLDYQRELDSDAIREACGRGRPGSACLRAALEAYIPELARTKSDLEDEFLYLCSRFKIPLPEVNRTIHGIEVDCHWPDLQLVVELDGGRNHGTSSQRTRDQRKAMNLRAYGIPVIRYTQDQVFRDSKQVAKDLLAQIEQRRKAPLAA
jgi:very-short-patch-repair endonuclease